MKKWIIRIAIVVVVLIVVAVVAVGLFLDSGIKKGVETFGPELTKVSVKLDSVSLSILSGSGSIKGLEVGNPQGYKAPTAIKLDKASVAISPGSLLSDKIVVKSIRIDGPEINIEGSPTKNNLTKILENVEAATGGTSTGGASTNAPATSSKPAKKLQVDEFVLSNAKINYTIPGIGVTVPVSIPEIKLNNLGTGPEGITGAELTKLTLNKLTTELVPALTEAGTKAAANVKDAAKKLTDEGSKVIKGVTDIFKKK